MSFRRSSKVIVVSALALAGAATAIASPEGSGSFREALASLLARLQAVEAATAQNTASIGALAGEIDALKASGAQTYDYRNYEADNVATRTYAMQGVGACGTTEIQTFTRTPLGDGSTQITQDRVRRTAGNVICERNVFDFRATIDGLYLAGRTGYSAANPTEVVNTNTIDVPLMQRTTTMRVGATWGSASGQSQVVYPAATLTQGAATQTNSLLAVESVSVPAGNFASCLRIVETRSSFSIGAFTQVSWYCQGVGMAKRVVQPSNGNGYTLALQSFTVQ